MKKNEKVLKTLKEFLNQLPTDCKVYIFGGLAVDGFRGKLTRNHDDIDFICWRKDVKKVQHIIKKMGFGIKTSPHPENPRKVCSFVSDDKNEIITFQIIDKKPNDRFEINFWHFPHQVFKNSILGPKNLTLDSVTFPSVTIKLLSIFHENASKYFEKIKQTNPELYKHLGYKLKNHSHNVKIINKLEKKYIS
jgi:hypothetical protein